MRAIGIDIGTTSICGILLDTDNGNIIKSITKNSDAFIKTENEWEKIQDTEKIINIAFDITNELLCEGVTSIGITGQMHGIVYIDKNGRAISPLYTWQDGRGNLKYDDNHTYSQILGLPSGYGNVTDFYNTKNGIRPDDAATFCTIHDYFAMRLCTLKSPVIHTSDAASFGGFDLKTNTFGNGYNPKISTGFDIIGTYNDIPVSVAIGDNQASVFGALQNDNDILLNIGTGSQISVISDTIITGENIEVRPYTSNNYLIVGAALCGGRAYSMLEKFFGEIVYAATGEKMDMYAVLDKMELSDTEHIVCDTRFDGTRQDPSITGSITNITTKNFTPAEFKYAFLDGIITELYNMFLEMNLKRGSLVGSGNGIRKNKSLLKLSENIFDAKMKIPMHLEEAAFGAALFAMTATGNFGSENEVKRRIRYE